MVWLKTSDVAAHHPVVLRPLLEEPPETVDATDMVNLVFGLVNRCATSAAGYRTDYRVDDAVVAMMGGPNWRARAELAERAGYWTRTDDGGWLIIEDPENLFHIRLSSELDWEAARKKDTANPSLIVPVRLRDGDGCRYCGVIVTWGVQRGGRGGTYDHRVPGQAATSPDDLRVSCRQCNTRRGSDPRADSWMPPQPSPASPHYGAKTVALLAEHGHRVPRSRSRRAPASTTERPGTQPDTAAPRDPATRPDTAHTTERPGTQPDTAAPRDPTTGTPRIATPQTAHRNATAMQKHDTGMSARRDPVPNGTPHEQPKHGIHKGSAKTANRGTTGSQNPGRVGSGREPTYPNPDVPARRRRGRRGKALPPDTKGPPLMPSSLSFDTIAARGLPPFLGEPGIECAEAPELFYPQKGDDTGVALAACRRCTHREPCLQFAVDTHQRHGIWGGTTPPERARIITRIGANG